MSNQSVTQGEFVAPHGGLSLLDRYRVATFGLVLPVQLDVARLASADYQHLGLSQADRRSGPVSQADRRPAADAAPTLR